MERARPDVVVFDVVGTLFGLGPVEDALAAEGAPAGLLEAWFERLLHSATALTLAGEYAPFAEIAKTARTEKVDLVVMGSYGGRSGSVDKIFFGSTAEKVVRTAGCPVLTVPLPASAVQRKSTH